MAPSEHAGAEGRVGRRDNSTACVSDAKYVMPEVSWSVVTRNVCVQSDSVGLRLPWRDLVAFAMRHRSAMASPIGRRGKFCTDSRALSCFFDSNAKAADHHCAVRASILWRRPIACLLTTDSLPPRAALSAIRSALTSACSAVSPDTEILSAHSQQQLAPCRQFTLNSSRPSRSVHHVVRRSALRTLPHMLTPRPLRAAVQAQLPRRVGRAQAEHQAVR